MFGWFNNSPRAETSFGEGNRARPWLECLEDRTTPAVGLDPFTGQLFIFQTNGDDFAGVVQDAFGNIIVNDNGAISIFAPGQVGVIFYYGADGNDLFINNTNIVSTAFGGFGADVLVGGSNQDFLIGNDLFVPGGDGSADFLAGGAGPDVFVSEPLFFDAFGNPVINPLTGLAFNLEFLTDFNPFQGDVLF